MAIGITVLPSKDNNPSSASGGGIGVTSLKEKKENLIPQIFAPGPRIDLLPQQDFLPHQTPKKPVLTISEKKPGFFETFETSLRGVGFSSLLSFTGGAQRMAAEIIKRVPKPALKVPSSIIISDITPVALNFVGTKLQEYSKTRLKDHPEWKKPDYFSKKTGTAGIIENLKTYPKEYLATTIGENAPTLGAQIIVALTTGGTGGMIFMGLGSGSETFDQAKAAGFSENKALSLGILRGTVEGALEKYGLDSVLKNPVGKKMVNSFISNLFTGIKTTGTAALKEAGTEFLQEINANAIAKTFDKNRSLLEGAPEAGFSGLLLGGGLRGFQEIGVKGFSIEEVPQEPEQKTGDTGRTKPQPLAQEARKYKSAEEFVSKIQGSATQYGDYTPQFRHLGMEGYKNVAELGVKPDKTITIYRGIDDISGKIPRKINDGDFVTTDFDSAASYAGKDNVVSMEVPAKTLYTDAIDDFKTDPFYTGSEYVYTTQKVEPLTKSQLTDIWNKAQKELPTKGVNTGATKPTADLDDFKREIDELFEKQSPITRQKVEKLTQEQNQLRQAEILALDEVDLTFPDSELENQFNNFKKLAPQNKLLGIKDQPQLKATIKKATPEQIDNILYSQELKGDEVLDMFKERLQQESKLLNLKKEAKQITTEIKLEEKNTNIFLQGLQKDIKKSLERKFARERLIEIGKKRGALEQKFIEQRVARRQVAVQKRQARSQKKDALQEQRIEILNILRERQEDISAIRSSITEYAIDRLPLNERGKLLVMVRDAKTQTDLTKAYLRIESRAQQVELDQSIKDLQKRIDTFLDSPKIAVEYRARIKDLVGGFELKGHTTATIQKLKNTKAFLQKELSGGKDVYLPTRVLEKLEILNRVPKNQITTEIITKITNELDLLEQLGETKLRAREALYNNEKELRIEFIKKEAVNITGKEKIKREIGEDLQFSDNIKNTLISAYNLVREKNLTLTPIDGLAEITGMSALKDGLDVQFSSYSQHELRTYVLDKRLEIIEKYKLTDKNMERAGVFALSQQKGGLEKLANLGITQEQVDKLVLTSGEREYYNFVRETFDGWYPQVKDYMKNVYNQDVGKVENYVSFQTDFQAMSEIEHFERFGTLADQAVERYTKTIEKGFAEARKGAGTQKVKINLDDIFLRHTDDVAYMLTMGRDIKMWGEILNKPEVKESMGDVSSVMWRQWLGLMARKGGTDGAKRIAALDIIRRNIGVGVLGFRLSSVMIQVTALADGASIIGSKYTYKGASNIATSKEWRQFIFDNFPEIRNAVGDDPAFIELSDTWLGKVSEAGIWPLKKLDGLARSTVASGAYEMLARQKGIAVDLTKPDKGLIQEAQKIVRQSQGSSSFKDQPLAISKGTFTGNKSVDKLIFQFQSFMLNRWDNIKRQIWREGFKQKNYKKAATGVLWLLGVATMMEMGIRKGVSELIDLITGDEEDEKEKEKILQNVFLNLIQNVPIMGSLVSSLVYNSNPVPAISTAERALGGARSVIFGKEFETKLKGAIRALGGFGATGGVAGSTQAADLLLDLIKGQKEKKSTPSKKLKSLPGLPVLPFSKLPSLPGLPELP